MESFVDISTLTIEEVTGTLRAADEVDTPPPPPSPQVSGGKLLLTEEQWLDRYKQKDGDPGRGGTNSGGWGKRRGKPRGRGGKGTSEGRSYSGRASQDDECRRCGKKGHWAKDCRGKLKVKEEAYAAQEIPTHISDPASLARAASSYKLLRDLIKDPTFLDGLKGHHRDHGFTSSLLLGFFYQESSEAPSHLWQHHSDKNRCLAPSFIPTSDMIQSSDRGK
jgi:hypothetical protein